jgi:hypothetical protein
LLISGFAVPVPAAPLVLPISLQLSIQLGDDTGRSYAARVVKYADVGANADRDIGNALGRVPKGSR